MEQITLNLQQAKQEIKEEMAKTAQSFVIIGYRLRQILDSGAYVQDGYTDFNEFAKKEFGLSQSGTSRFISINKKYSIDGYGPELREEYRGYSCSQLTEMLSLSSDDRALVSDNMPVSQIREVKEFVRGEDTSGQQSFITAANVSEHDMYLNMFQKEPEQLRYICESGEVTGKELCELMNPTGSRVFKFKTIMMCMYEESRGISVRVIGGGNVSHTYDELLEDIRQQVTEEDIEELVNATSHIEEPAKEEPAKKEEPVIEKPQKKEEKETKDEERNMTLESEAAHVEESESALEGREAGQESQNDRNEDVPVEKVEGEVVEEEPVQQVQEEFPKEKDTKGWIPCEEKFPENDRYILLSFSNFNTPMVGRFESDSEGGAFYIGDEMETCASQDMFVNAWMPLPEPYRPEGD